MKKIVIGAFLGLLLIVALAGPPTIQHYYALEIPLSDQYKTPGRFLIEISEGNFHWTHLFEPHNESRKVFNSIIWIALAEMFGWRPKLEMLVCYLFAVSSMIGLIYLIYRTNAKTILKALSCLGIVWTICNLSSFEHWLWGMALGAFMLNFCFVLCMIWLELSWTRPWIMAFGALILSIFGMLTFASGILFIPLLFIVLLLVSQKKEGQWRLGISQLVIPGLFGVLGMILIVLYMNGLKRGDTAGGLIHDPIGTAMFIFRVIGSSLVLSIPRDGAMSSLSAIAGLLILTVSALLVFLSIRNIINGSDPRPYVPWLLALLFGVVSASLIASGRIMDNPYAWLSGRYICHLSPFYWGIIGLNLVLASSLDGKRTSPPNTLSWAGLTLPIILIFAIMLNSLSSVPRIRECHARNIIEQERLRLAMAGYPVDNFHEIIYPDKNYLLTRMSKLRDYGWLQFTIPNFRELMVNNADKTIVLTFSDANGVQKVDVREPLKVQPMFLLVAENSPDYAPVALSVLEPATAKPDYPIRILGLLESPVYENHFVLRPTIMTKDDDKRTAWVWLPMMNELYQVEWNRSRDE